MIIVLSNKAVFNLANVTWVEPMGEMLRVYFVDGYQHYTTLDEKLAAEFLAKCRALSALQYAEVETK